MSNHAVFLVFLCCRGVSYLCVFLEFPDRPAPTCLAVGGNPPSLPLYLLFFLLFLFLWILFRFHIIFVSLFCYCFAICLLLLLSCSDDSEVCFCRGLGLGFLFYGRRLVVCGRLCRLLFVRIYSRCSCLCVGLFVCVYSSLGVGYVFLLNLAIPFYVYDSVLFLLRIVCSLLLYRVWVLGVDSPCFCFPPPSLRTLVLLFRVDSTCILYSVFL